MEMRDEQVSRLSKEEVRHTMTKVYSIIRMDRENHGALESMHVPCLAASPLLGPPPLKAECYWISLSRKEKGNSLRMLAFIFPIPFEYSFTSSSTGHI